MSRIGIGRGIDIGGGVVPVGSTARVVPAYPTGLVHEYRASAGAYSSADSSVPCTDATLVQFLTDQGGVVNLGQPTSGDRPTWHSNALSNANPGLAAGMTWAGTAGMLLSGTARSLGTSFAIVATLIYQGDGGIIDAGASDYALYLFGGTMRVNINGTVTASLAHGMTAGNVYTIAARVEAATAYFYVGQTTKGSGNVGNTAFSPTVIGALGGGSNSLTGSLIAVAEFSPSPGNTGTLTAIAHQQAQYGS